MVWSRTDSFLDIAAWLLMTGMWWSGGYLLVTRVFNLRIRERLFAGMAAGFLLLIVVSNLFAYITNLPLGYWVAAGLILAAGLVSKKVFQNNTVPFSSESTCYRDQVIIFIGLLVLFLLINAGLSIFDDNNNIPLVSQLAAGDFPPHFYLDPAQRLDYHYGMHMFAASLVQVGGLHPWSALDFTKAFSLSMMLVLVWLWFRRMVSPRVFLITGLLFVLFATGTRWLLLLIPERNLETVSSHIHLTGSALSSGPTLSHALISPWDIEGGSPIPFPFAFANGIIPPVVLAMTGSGAIPQLSLVLFLLLMKRTSTSLQKMILGLVLASSALTGEHLFIMIWIGLFLAIIIQWLTSRPRREFLPTAINWLWFLAPGLLIALLGGGVLSEFLLRLLNLSGGSQSSGGVGFGGMSLRFPPAVISAHLGVLSLSDLTQVLVALAEIGLVILLAVPVFSRSLKRLRTNDISYVGVSIAASIGLVLPMVIQLSLRARDISRMTGMALFILIILGFPAAVLVWKKSGNSVKGLLFCAFLVTILGGVVLSPSVIVAVARPEASYYISPLDVQMSDQFWNSLAIGTTVFDPNSPSRPMAIFARSIGQAFSDIFTPYPKYQALLSDPHPLKAAKAGYAYYYLDRDTWDTLPAELHLAFDHDCVDLIYHISSEDGDFRTLYDIQRCQ